MVTKCFHVDKFKNADAAGKKSRQGSLWVQSMVSVYFDPAIQLGRICAFAPVSLYFSFACARNISCRHRTALLYVQVVEHKWTHHAIPLTSLSTTVFLGPSPLWCVAGGHVWFDRPGDHRACLPHGTVTSVIHGEFVLVYFISLSAPTKGKCVAFNSSQTRCSTGATTTCRRALRSVCA